ncbi:MAG: hemolysin family protein [Bacteroidia bacterium]|nr:hemolysin family protein [Bacteroidia bacterium]MDW8333285.1 hemolysin family protein [Bacteroidia bacterium]
MDIAVILALMVFNGLFAMAEIAFISSRRPKLEDRKRHGDARAGVILALKEHPERVLSTLQIGITLVGTLAAAYGGKNLADDLSDYFSRLPLLSRYAGELALTVVVALITYLELVVGELAPKSIAILHPEKIACAFARVLKTLNVLAAPLVGLLSFSTRAALKLIGVKPARGAEFTEEEFKLMIDHGAEQGVFENEEQAMIKGVIRLGNQRADAVMTHRSEIVWLDVSVSQDRALEIIFAQMHLFYPVADGSLDKLLGVVSLKDVFRQIYVEKKFDLPALVRLPVVVHEKMPALDVLELLKKEKAQMAVVVNEYGGLEGVVTLNDIVGALVGDVGVFDRQDEPEIVVREDGSFLVDGMANFDQVREMLDLLDDGGEGDYVTVGGFVMYKLGRLPQTGDRFEVGRYRFEVVDMDKNRVDKVLICAI